MIICHSHRFIYIHPPKTAGTAISIALGALCGPDDAQIGDWPNASYAQPAALKGLGKHAPLAMLQERPFWGDIANYKLVLSTRNSWDRMVSFYHWARQQDFKHLQIKIAKAHDFAGFLGHRRIQNSFRTSPYRNYIATPDFTLHAENLAAGLVSLGDALGVELGVPARVNASGRQRDWRPYYSDETRALVADICAIDIAEYGYAFDDAVQL
ncbi:MAG: Type II secretory pathway, pullulanase PulA [Paracoccaceae bacterium]